MHYTQSKAWQEEQRRKKMSPEQRLAEDKEFLQKNLAMLDKFEKPTKGRKGPRKQILMQSIA